MSAASKSTGSPAKPPVVDERGVVHLTRTTTSGG